MIMGKWMIFSLSMLAVSCGAEVRSIERDAGVAAASGFDAGHTPGPSSASSAGAARDASGEAAAPSTFDAGSCQQRFCPAPATWHAETCSCQETCDLNAQVTADVPRSGTIDCGTLDVKADAAARQAAEQCVLNAVHDRTPFRMVQRQQGTDSVFATGYASGGVGDLIAIYFYDRDPFGAGMGFETIDATYCRSLKPSPMCQVTQSSTCLTCDELVASGRVCDGRPDQAKNTCFGPGNYEAEKEGGYRPCCEGLNQAQVKVAAGYGADSSQHECVQEPANTYVCIEGRCGDGVCEAPESIACACPTDCPSAVWGPGDAGVDDR
jgi:hypothetical protein